MSDAAPAGFYDDGAGRRRWWDGQQWTDRYEDETQSDGVKTAAAAAVGKVREKHDPSAVPGAIWSAVGKPLTGIGAGRYTLTPTYLMFEKGTLSTKSQQIPVIDIFDVDGSQTMTQKARGIGTITLFAQRSDGSRERVLLEDVPDFRAGVAAINNASTTARAAWQKAANTQYLNHVGAAQQTPGVAQAPAAAAAPVDVNAELAKLAAFREQGILDDEEFTAAKRKLLGL